MENYRFKPGDTVRVIDAQDVSGLFLGNNYIVESYEGAGYPPYILTLAPDERFTGSNRRFFESRFALVTPTPKQETTPMTDTTFGEITVTNGVPVKGTGRSRYVVAQEFGNELIVDVRARSSTNADTHTFIDKLVAGATAANKTVRYVDSLTDFFDPKARYAAFVKSGFTDTQGVTLTTAEIDALKLVDSIKDKFKTAFTVAAATPPKPAYVKAPVPANIKDPLSGITIGAKALKRNGYSLSRSAFEKTIWPQARDFWRGERSSSYTNNFRAEGTTRYATFSNSALSIGCQTLQRYQVEALAEKLGLEF